MMLRTALRYLRGGHALGRSMVLADLYPVMRTQFLHAALESGLLRALRIPRTRAEILTELGVENDDLLDVMLEHGVAWRELRETNGRYAIRGRRSRALASEAGDAHAAFLQETVSYHGSVFTELAERLRGEPAGDYLGTTAELVARSSRVGEPASAAFLLDVIRRRRPQTVLDAGCGSAVHLRYAASRRNITGVGVEISPAAAAHARSNIEAWGLEDRMRIVCADVRDRRNDLTGPFDLVLLFHNVYYFAPDERPALFARLHDLVSPRGAVALVCVFHGGGRLATNMDVVLRSTKGNTALPDLDETIGALGESGFTVAKPRRLVAFEPLYGIIAERRSR